MQKPALRKAEQVLQSEMTELLGAGPGERAEGRSGYRLSSCDASYLELAMRAGLPLATLDRDLRTAASKAGVPRLAAG